MDKKYCVGGIYSICFFIHMVDLSESD